MIVSNPDTCSSANQRTIGIIRSDFTICSNPADSLDKSCIQGSDNEPENCGFRYVGTVIHNAPANLREGITFWDYAFTVQTARQIR
jgi:hypothetical protein